MDFISHGLWGAISFGRRNRKTFLIAGLISILPDLLTEGLFFVLYILGIGGMPGWENGHPNITDYPIYAQTLYNITHSLVIFAIVFIIISIAIKRPIWIIAGWGLHILIDIPTHALELFPTPFLWPISEFKVDGIGWRHPAILGADIVLLIIAYGFWLCPRYKRRAARSN